MKLLRYCFVLAVAMLAGCTTSSPQAGAVNQMRLKSDIDNLQEETMGINGRLEALEVLQSELKKNQFETREGSRNSVEALSARMLRMEEQIGALESARQKDREEISRALSEKLLRLVGPSGGRGTTSRPAGGSEYAYEHVVQKGETISAIAVLYKATVEAIVRENNLRNPDAIREGQKLYVPR